MIPYEDLKLLNAPHQDAFNQIFSQFVDSGWYILGNHVQQFEAEFAKFCGAKYAIGVASGLDALKISLMALDLPPQSEVLVPANSYIATILAILNANCVPVLVEPTIKDANLDASCLKAHLSAKTKAIMPIHLYGAPCDMSAISTFAKEHGLHIIEDCAQAHGAKHRGQHVGTFGSFGAFSFYPTKNLGALGDAGAIITNDADLFARCKMIRNYGEKAKYQNECIGVNSRLDELQAAILRHKLKFLPQLNEHKRQLASIYHQNLNPEFNWPQYSPQDEVVYHIFAIRHPLRDKIKALLHDHGIGSNIHYPTPPFRQPACARYFNGEYPISDEWAAHQLSLPISGMHTSSDIEQVIEVLNQ